MQRGDRIIDCDSPRTGRIYAVDAGVIGWAMITWHGGIPGFINMDRLTKFDNNYWLDYEAKNI